MATRIGVFYFKEESDYNNAKDDIYNQMYSDYGYPKVEIVGYYGGEYRIDVWDECSDDTKAFSICRRHRGRYESNF